MNDWTWRYEGYDPARERLREALCTLGNGYFATRGAAPECTADGMHYPGTYAAGCYNRLTSTVAGREVENEDMVNLPNWLPLRFRAHSDGTADTAPETAWFSPDAGGLLAHEQTLDLRSGTLTRAFRCEDAAGRRIRVQQTRFLHMADPHLAVLRTVLEPENWSGLLDVESGLDGEVTNSGVARYRDLAGRHLTGVTTGIREPDTVWLHCRTTRSDIGIGMAARTTTTPQPASSRLEPGTAHTRRLLLLPAAPGRPATVDKTVALHTSRDPAVGDPLQAVLDRAGQAPPYADLLASHRRAWHELWERAELDVPGEAGRILRFHLFHVLQTLSPHTAGLDVGVPARGLHGEAYRGHVFWDELFVLPYLNLHFPEVSRALLDYRHRRLPRACRSAREAGRLGAMYPWQSAADGREETQEVHLNPRSGRWLPDHSRLQHHVGSAVAYNVWHYCEATGDTGYLQTRGAEMLTQIARFWASGAEFDPALGRYRIRGVVGPDEYHEGYPDASAPGLDDNAYTNVTAAWVLTRALEVVRALPEPRRRQLFEETGTDPGEPDRWEEVSRRLHVPFHRGVISQFEGYGELAELDWDGYRRRYGNIRRLDRILEAEGDSANRYQASKQADALMLGYLFPPAELAGIFRHLGYELDDDTWRRTVDYYLRRTSHGSTLSGLVHGWVLARVRRAEAWEFCLEALKGDVADIQGGTTEEGIHLGAMAGTLDLVQRGLTGMDPRADALVLDPAPLPELSEYCFTVRYHNHWGLAMRLSPGQLRIDVPASDEPPVRLVLPDRSVTLDPGESCTLELTEP
ncbi:glycoside hydrolase family 65 protein [Streptomyces sp. S07_1.15]|uniref:glycoside hydrolase family 65 protein n=1 Tax=Streptomyces sp. S07_1.15 TaxID=2873925 RepID=UPI001D150EB2|nr:glycosyl hydrolase family 65 protein [Streptomyces sp. S07_1.15]MCC3655429.1 glycoside hydrolase family 65 protein [Streptomyces sp. S07_1.15]